MPVPGPFEGVWIGCLNTPVRIYDLSEAGCFVSALQTVREVDRPLSLKIDVPNEGWIRLKVEVLYAEPTMRFAVSFVDVPADAAERLQRGLLWLRGLIAESRPNK